MTFNQAKRKLMEVSKGAYHQLEYKLIHKAKGVYVQECTVYVHAYNHHAGSSWENALSSLDSEMNPKPDAIEGQPMDDVVNEGGG